MGKRMATALLAGLLLLATSGSAVATGTLLKGPDAVWARALPDSKLGTLRGGFAGLSFSVFFSGFFDKLGNVNGNLNVSTGGASTAPLPQVAVSDGQVRISNVIGNFQGATGIFQITQAGSFNVINNNLFVQIAVVNVLNGAAIPPMASLFGPVP